MGGGEFSFIFKPYHGFVLISCCKENAGVNSFENFFLQCLVLKYRLGNTRMTSFQQFV